MGAPDELQALEAFVCPRCGTTVSERFWGPCQACRAQLVQTFRGQAIEVQATEVQTTRFEPSMHVVPNHVATKD